MYIYDELPNIVSDGKYRAHIVGETLPSLCSIYFEMTAWNN